MYSRFVKILKFVQILDYIDALLLALIYAKVAALPLAVVFGINYNYKIFFLLFAIFLCFVNYLGTQTIIAVIDLINRIESNTRNMRRN